MAGVSDVVTILHEYERAPTRRMRVRVLRHAFDEFRGMRRADLVRLGRELADRLPGPLLMRIEDETGVGLMSGDPGAIVNLFRKLDRETIREVTRSLAEVEADDVGEMLADDAGADAEAEGNGDDQIAETEADAETEAEPGPETEVELEVEPEAELEAEPEAQTDADAEGETETKGDVAATRPSPTPDPGSPSRGERIAARLNMLEPRAPEPPPLPRLSRAEPEISISTDAGGAAPGVPSPTSALAERVRSSTTAAARLACVDDAASLRAEGPDRRAQVLAGLPDGWQRRRGAERMVEAGAIDDETEALAVVRSLSGRGNATWVAGRLLSAGFLSAPALETLEDLLGERGVDRLRHRARHART